MDFEKALYKACRVLQLDGHIKEIRYKKDANTYAEKIATQFGVPKNVKNSYLYLDGVDFCFFQNGNECDFAISGYIHGNDKHGIKYAISQALDLCERTEYFMKYGEDE